jgi:uncharacterized protein (DUF885 family)
MTPRDRSHAHWMDDFFASYYVHRPVNATFVGVHEHDDRLPDPSENGAGDLLADIRSLRARLVGAPVPEASAAAIDRRLARGFLDIEEWELTSSHFHRGNPSLYTGDAVFGVIGLFLTDFAPLEHRTEAAMARMHAVPDFLAQARRNVRRAPASWTERAIRDCDGAMTLFERGLPLLAETSSIRSPAFTKALSTAASAFAEHRRRLRVDLLPTDHDRVGVGSEALALYLREGHALEQTAEQIADYAEARLRKAEAFVRQEAAELGARTPQEILVALRDRHPEADRYYDAYQECWEELRRVVIEEALVTWPDFPLRYVPRPQWVRQAAPHLYFLFYRSPAAFERPGMHDYLVAPLPENDPTEFLRSNNDSVIKLNHVIHHGGLGHHVQNWYAFRAESRIGRMAAVDCASRIAVFCGGTMAEGWACYATALAAEVGVLTPLEALAEHHSQIRIAARAVVDVRLHSGQMTLDDAARFYEERAAMSAVAARGEAVKNSMFPGTALMYLMGKDAIHDLRTEMRTRTGSDFDLRAFHDELLSWGSIPVPLIATEMKKKIDDDR